MAGPIQDQIIQQSDVLSLLHTANGLTGIQGSPFDQIAFEWTDIYGGTTDVSVGTMVWFNGVAYVCILQANQLLIPPPLDTTHWQIKTINNRGSWSSANTYNQGDEVTQFGWIFIYTGTSPITGDGSAPLITDISGNTTLQPNWVQTWLQAFNRMRASVKALMQNGWTLSDGTVMLAPWQISVSGQPSDFGENGWPCGTDGPGAAANYNHLYDNLNFFYEYKGTNGYVSLTESFTDGLYGVFSSQTWNMVTHNADGSITTTIAGAIASGSISLSFKIAGQAPPSGFWTLNAKFIVRVQVLKGYTQTGGMDPVPDGVDPNTLWTIDSSSFIPGFTFSQDSTVYTDGGGNYWVQATCTIVNGFVAPGTYSVVISTTTIPPDDTIYYYTPPTPYQKTVHTRVSLVSNTDGFALPGRLDIQSPSGSGNATISNVYSVPVQANGLSTKYPILRIPLTAFDGNGYPAGFVGIQHINDISGGYWYKTPYPSPTFLPVSYDIVGSWSVNTNVAGFWWGKIPPISSAGMDGLQGYMQENRLHYVTSGTSPNQTYRISSTSLIPYTGGGVTHTAPVAAYSNIGQKNWQRQLMPCQWIASVWYPVGFSIQDSNGNIQTATTAGRSGTSHPTWSTAFGGTTAETSQNSGESGVVWKLTYIPAPPDFNSGSIGNPSYTQAISRNYSIPTYPAVWFNDLISPPTIPPQPQQILPDMTQVGYGDTQGGAETSTVHGWWIYKVYLNRIQSGGPIPVTLGCYRNNAFVSFGTYQTGTTVAAMWPIFVSVGSESNPPLVYQASERVDVQAVIVTGTSQWGSVNYPLLYSYYQDMATLFSLPPPS